MPRVKYIYGVRIDPQSRVAATSFIQRIEKPLPPGTLAWGEDPHFSVLSATERSKDLLKSRDWRGVEPLVPVEGGWA